MTDDPYQAPVTATSEEQSKPPRVVVFALLGIIVIAAAVTLQNYRRQALIRETVIRRLQLKTKAEEVRQSARAAEEDSSTLPETTTIETRGEKSIL